MNFENELNKFIDDNYNETVTPEINIDNAFKIITIKNKKLSFAPITYDFIKTNSPKPEYFQQISIKYADENRQIIFIWEDFWRTKQEIVKNRILSHLKKFNRIHARQCKVARISKPQLDSFLHENHLQGSSTAKYKYALLHKDTIVAAASFSAGRPIQRNGETYRSYELVRFANSKNNIVAGGIGKILARFIEEQSPDDIMSYADLDWSSGKSYEKLGFEFIEYTKPQKFFVNINNNQRYYPAKINNIDVENLIAIYNSGNKKYLLRLK